MTAPTVRSAPHERCGFTGCRLRSTSYRATTPPLATTREDVFTKGDRWNQKHLSVHFAASAAVGA